MNLLTPGILERYDSFGVNHIDTKFPYWGRKVNNVVISAMQIAASHAYHVNDLGSQNGELSSILGHFRQEK